MTVSTDNNKNRYEGNGVTDTFAFSGRVFSASDIVADIITRSTDTLVETLTNGSGITVTLTGDESASVVTDAGKIPSGTQDILVRRALPRTQTVDLPTGTRFPAKSVENALDKNVATLQDLAEEVSRAVVVPTTSEDTPPTIGALTASTILQVDSTGAILESSTLNTSDLAALNAIAADITTVAGISANVTTVAGISGNVTTVAGISANVTTVAGISANVTTVAGISGDVTTVAGDSTDIQALALISADITTVSSISSDVTTAAGISANITTVAGISANVTTVAGISGDVTTVASNDADISTVATDITNVNTVASNITDVNSFANIYRIAASDPVASLDEGDLVYNTTQNVLKYYDGAAWQTIAPGITAVVEDTTPQLGGNLDVNGKSIVSVSNGNIVIAPNGTGEIQLDGLSWPTADGSANQFLQTNGAGQLSFAEAGGGGAWELISSQTAVSDSIIDFSSFTDDTKYDVYWIVGSVFSISNTPIYGRLENSGGYVNSTNAYREHFLEADYSSAATVTSRLNTQMVLADHDGGSGDNNLFTINAYLHQMTNTSRPTMVDITGKSRKTTFSNYGNYLLGWSSREANEENTGIRIASSSMTGYIAIYGLLKS